MPLQGTKKKGYTRRGIAARSSARVDSGSSDGEADRDDEIGEFTAQRALAKSKLTPQQKPVADEWGHVFSSGRRNLTKSVSAKSAPAVKRSTAVSAGEQMSFRSKCVLIEDYEFSQRAVTVIVGQTVEFLLSDTVPEHVEHWLEGECPTDQSLSFTSGLLQVCIELPFYNLFLASITFSGPAMFLMFILRLQGRAKCLCGVRYIQKWSA
jgi:hypothetical protein